MKAIFAWQRDFQRARKIGNLAKFTMITFILHYLLTVPHISFLQTSLTRHHLPTIRYITLLTYNVLYCLCTSLTTHITLPTCNTLCYITHSQYATDYLLKASLAISYSTMLGIMNSALFKPWKWDYVVHTLIRETRPTSLTSKTTSDSAILQFWYRSHWQDLTPAVLSLGSQLGLLPIAEYKQTKVWQDNLSTVCIFHVCIFFKGLKTTYNYRLSRQFRILFMSVEFRSF